MSVNSQSCDPHFLETNALYGVAVAPFLARPLGVTASTDSWLPNDTITLNVTTDTALETRPVTLPMWFAMSFCSFRSVELSVEAEPSKAGALRHREAKNPSAFLWSPTCAVDRHRRISITPVQTDPPVCGMSKVGKVYHSPVIPDSPPPVLGTDQERRAFAGASAHLVLSARDAVPHKVVPSLVFEHVVAPFVANACCSFEQSWVGITSWGHVNGSDPCKSLPPNLKRLEVSVDWPLPDSVEALVFRGYPRSFECIPTARNLRSLTFDCVVNLTGLEALAAQQPVITLENLVIDSFESLTRGSDGTFRRLILLSECFPRIRALRCLRALWEDDEWVAEHFQNTSYWPDLNTLDIAGCYIVDIVAARPTAWTHVTLRRTDTCRPVTNRLTVPTNIPNVEYLFVGCMESWQLLNLAKSVALRVLHLPYLRDEGETIAAPQLTHLSLACPATGDRCERALFNRSHHDVVAHSVNALACRPTLRRVTFQSEGVSWERRRRDNTWARHEILRDQGVRYERYEQGLAPSHAHQADMYTRKLHHDFLRDRSQLCEFTPGRDHVIPFRLVPPNVSRSASVDFSDPVDEFAREGPVVIGTVAPRASALT